MPELLTEMLPQFLMQGAAFDKNEYMEVDQQTHTRKQGEQKTETEPEIVKTEPNRNRRF